MATWMAHLRIADSLFKQFYGLQEREFIVGSLAPDSGVPNEDWSCYEPPSHVTHFRDEENRVQCRRYTDQYFTKEQQKSYPRPQFSFYFGYLTHLMTDILWDEWVVAPCRQKHGQEAEDKKELTRKMKADWYDLDFLFLSKNPGFRAWQVYQNAVGFMNTYMDIFTTDAFDQKRAYIADFYGQKRSNLNREYPYLSEQQMDSFVDQAADRMIPWAKMYTL